MALVRLGIDRRDGEGRWHTLRKPRIAATGQRLGAGRQWKPRQRLLSREHDSGNFITCCRHITQQNRVPRNLSILFRTHGQRYGIYEMKVYLGPNASQQGMSLSRPPETITLLLSARDVEPPPSRNTASHTPRSHIFS